MISGKQIREARTLLGWGLLEVGRRAKLPVEIVLRAESVDGTPSITIVQADKLKAVFEAAGVRFGRRSGVMKLAADTSGDNVVEQTGWFT